MKAELVQTLTYTFEGHAQKTEQDIEYWMARDLQHLLGYTEWRNFGAVLSKAKTASELSGHPVSDHFVDVHKMVDLGSGSQREVDDLMLAVQTRKAELIAQRLLEAERIAARKKLSLTEKDLSEVIFERTGGNQDPAFIRSRGDHALFGKSTQATKAQWQVPDTLLQRGIRPESLPAAEDVKKLARRFGAEEKKALSKPDALAS